MLRECTYCNKTFDRGKARVEDDCYSEICDSCFELLTEYNNTHPVTDKEKIEYMINKLELDKTKNLTYLQNVNYQIQNNCKFYNIAGLYYFVHNHATARFNEMSPMRKMMQSSIVYAPLTFEFKKNRWQLDNSVKYIYNISNNKFEVMDEHRNISN